MIKEIHEKNEGLQNNMENGQKISDNNNEINDNNDELLLLQEKESDYYLSDFNEEYGIFFSILKKKILLNFFQALYKFLYFIEDDIISSSNVSTISDENNINEIWNNFYELLETTLTKNSTLQQLSTEQVRELINDFNCRQSSLIEINNNYNNQRVSSSFSNSDMSTCSSVILFDF